ncbi:GlsB/YeaQ/YmgE family stress response membrane protein [Endozoicomonas atrinae]|uniref:GlsB/YeaQ/YmgE family stress response membrane protein n=1 Tax=Endozoicomonas atrinae TaxID=1333660 RepID=UPI000825CAC5|nr:GlsB/YeaQ/YmgE family stress response membrane protein [Endozoicomonas atrinae]
MGIIDILVFLVVGAIAGFLAGQFFKGSGFGLTWNMIIGIVGSVIGGLVFGILGFATTSLLGSIISATLGAILLLIIIQKIKA